MLRTSQTRPPPTRPGSDRHRSWRPSRWKCGDGERGEVNVSAVLLWPVVLAVVWLALQTGLYFYGRQVALSAAEQGAQAGRVAPFSAARADTAARGFIAAAAGGWVLNPRVATTVEASNVRVQVTGDAVSLLPLITFTITQESVQPLERITP